MYVKINAFENFRGSYSFKKSYVGTQSKKKNIVRSPIKSTGFFIIRKKKIHKSVNEFSNKVTSLCIKLMRKCISCLNHKTPIIISGPML